MKMSYAFFFDILPIPLLLLEPEEHPYALEEASPPAGIADEGDKKRKGNKDIVQETMVPEERNEIAINLVHMWCLTSKVSAEKETRRATIRHPTQANSGS